MQKLIFLVLAMIMVSAALAEVPHVITYQGRLVDSLGTPLDGEHQLVFSIYDVPEGGTPLWTSGVRTVLIEEGLFTYDLGSMAPIPDTVFTEHFERWLGISIGTAQELSPRTIINSVAFAYRAQFADGAGIAETAGHAEHANVAEDAAEAGHAVYADTAAYAHSAPGGAGIWIDNGTKVYLADSTDFVGIGTSNPSAELEIYSSGEPDLILTRKSSASAAFFGYKTGSSFTWSMYTPSGGDALYIQKDDWGTVFSCLQNGNVGIGTEEPTYRLTVDSGNLLIRGLQRFTAPDDSAQLILGDPNHGLASIYGQGLTFWTYGDGFHTIRFGNHLGDNYMTIGGGGHVAINTDVDVNERLYVHQLSGPGQVAIHGASWVSNPSFGGGVGVKGSFESDGVGGVGVYGSATALTPLGGLVGVYGYTDDPTSYAIYADGPIGSIGPISSIIETRSHGFRETYAVHSAGNWCEDFGSENMVDGVARVSIDPIFAETVRLDRNYHIFLTPMGDCGLYVAEKHADYFVVRAQNNQTCSIDFDYRIVAKRAGFEDKRLQSADRIAETTAILHQMENQEKSK